MQQPVGEDMAALGIAAKLDLVDRQEIDRQIERHQFDGADPISRMRRDDLFFAGDESDRPRAFERNNPVIILARQKPERKADHAACDGRACAQ